MKVIGKDRTSCDVCNPIDEILARLDALERRASAIVAKVQGIAPDGEGNVTLPTSSSDTDPLHGRVDTFAMSSEVKEAADDAHAYAASIADDVVVLQSDVEILTREVEALDPASVTALEQSVAALQQTVNQLSNLVGGFSAVIRDLEDQMPNKVDRTGDTMTGPLNVIDTVTGSRNAQAVNGNRLQNDLDSYSPMIRNTGNQGPILGIKRSAFIVNNPVHIDTFTTSRSGWHNVYDLAIPQGRWIGKITIGTVSNVGITSRTSYSELFVDIDGNGEGYLKILMSKGAYDMLSRVKLCHDENQWHLLVNCTSYIRHGFSLVPMVYGWGNNDTSFMVSNSYMDIVAEPDSRFDKIVECTEW